MTSDGTAEAQFTTQRFRAADLAGRAVILHAGADNFGNVPVGPASNQYTANSTDATTATANTGNAGVRIACGVVEGCAAWFASYCSASSAAPGGVWLLVCGCA